MSLMCLNVLISSLYRRGRSSYHLTPASSRCLAPRLVTTNKGLTLQPSRIITKTISLATANPSTPVAVRLLAAGSLLYILPLLRHAEEALICSHRLTPLSSMAVQCPACRWRMSGISTPSSSPRCLCSSCSAGSNSRHEKTGTQGFRFFHQGISCGNRPGCCLITDQGSMLHSVSSQLRSTRGKEGSNTIPFSVIYQEAYSQTDGSA